MTVQEALAELSEYTWLMIKKKVVNASKFNAERTLDTVRVRRKKDETFIEMVIRAGKLSKKMRDAQVTMKERAAATDEEVLRQLGIKP